MSHIRVSQYPFLLRTLPVYSVCCYNVVVYYVLYFAMVDYTMLFHVLRFFAIVCFSYILLYVIVGWGCTGCCVVLFVVGRACVVQRVAKLCVYMTCFPMCRCVRQCVLRIDIVPYRIVD